MYYGRPIPFAQIPSEIARDLTNVILSKAKAASEVPAIIDQLCALLRAEWTQIDWSQYEGSFGILPTINPDEARRLKRAGSDNRNFADLFEKFAEIAKQSVDPVYQSNRVATEAFGVIVREAKSSADVPGVIERLVAATREALEHEDWEVYADAFDYQPVLTKTESAEFINDLQNLSRDYQTLVEGIQQSTEIRLYEGLPYRNADSYYHERTTRKTLIIHNYRFYEEPLALRPEDAARLTRLCCDPLNFPLNGMHGSCVFHPDYCLEWRSAEQIIQILFCFTCGEVIGYRGSTKLSAPMNDEAFKPILAAYWKNLPHEERRF